MGSDATLALHPWAIAFLIFSLFFLSPAQKQKKKLAAKKSLLEMKKGVRCTPSYPFLFLLLVGSFSLFGKNYGAPFKHGTPLGGMLFSAGAPCRHF